MYKSVIKPFSDFLLSLTLLIVFFPIMVVVYILLLITGCKNPLFKQSRPGKGHEIFEIIKFKTMTDAVDEEGKLLPDNQRKTKLGHFLRKTSIDELPQLINVLKGEMSFVGPRPLRVRYLPYYTKREDLRHTVKPGITGLAQVSGRNAITWDNRLELDAVYVEKQSFLYDFKILLKTALKVFEFSETEFSGESDSLDEHRISGSIK